MTHTHPFTYQELSAYFYYDPDTGYIHKVSDGSRADYTNGGYRRLYTAHVKEGGTYYQAAHRVAWLLHTGQWPTHQIDHINADKQDNRIHNLREATATQNLRNRGVFKNNKLGVKGVCMVGTRFRAQLWKDGKFLLSKHFKTLAEASAAYEAAALEAFGAFHRKSPPIEV